MPASYEAYVRERYQGEVYGEAVFGRWARSTPDAAVARKLRLLAQLERETKEVLGAELRALGRDADEDVGRRTEGEVLGEQMAGADWSDILKGFASQIAPLIEEFEKAEALAPPGKQALLRQVTDHERALLSFAERELEGQHDSLAPVVALLAHVPD